MFIFQAAPEKTVVILHGCCHNPTGVNPTEEQLKEIGDLVEVLVLIGSIHLSFRKLEIVSESSFKKITAIILEIFMKINSSPLCLDFTWLSPLLKKNHLPADGLIEID